MLGLAAADVDVHYLAQFGIGHGGIDTAVDDGREGISFPLRRHIALAYIHARGEERGSQAFTRLFVHGLQFLRDDFIVRRFEEETDALETDRVEYAVHAHTGEEIDTARLLVLGLDIGFHLLRGGDIEACLP